MFWTPCRDAVYEDTYAEAKEANLECRGDSLASQAWGLIPRIREVDTLLLDDPEAQEKVQESHPEVCFAAFAGAELASKHLDDGLAARRDCLGIVEDGAADQYDEFVQTYIEDHPAWARRIGSSNEDDLLDAMILALTAKIGNSEYSRLPTNFSEETDKDREGLPMHIVYVEP